MALYIYKFNQIADYWCAKIFIGNAYFKKTMSLNEFQNIQSALPFYPPQQYSQDNVSKDPLRHSSIILEHFMRTISNIAVQNSISSLGEMSDRCSSRTAAKTYMSAKPKKFVMSF